MKNIEMRKIVASSWNEINKTIIKKQYSHNEKIL